LSVVLRQRVRPLRYFLSAIRRPINADEKDEKVIIRVDPSLSVVKSELSAGFLESVS